MAKIIQLTRLRIDRIIIDPQDQTLVVEFDIADDTGEYRKRLAATFYRKAPLGPDGSNPRALRDHEFILPQTYASGLVQLVGKLHDTLTTTYLA